MLFQVLAPIESAMPSLPTVTIRESLDARYSIYYKDQHLPAKLMPARMLAVPRAIKPLRNLTPHKFINPKILIQLTFRRSKTMRFYWIDC